MKEAAPAVKNAAAVPLKSVKLDSDTSLAPPEFMNVLKELTTEFHDVISDTLSEQPMKGEPVQIRLKAGEIKPFKVATARAIPLAFRDRANKMVSNLIDEKIIAPVPDDVVTQFCAPGFFLPKTGTDKLRFVTDFSALNRYVLRPVHPFMSTIEVLNAVPCDAKYFLKMDCVHGYFQVPLSEESSYLTTFLIPQGRHRFCRLPMGLSASSDAFCQRTDAALANLDGLIKLVDDLLIHATSLNSLMAKAKAVLSRCQTHGITISRRKLEIGTEVPFAGYVIGKDGIKPGTSRIETIMALPPPNRCFETSLFFGGCESTVDFLP